tara:strand:+ start:7155 stop:7385 length:231 start_codon:yes stop_codon:yes gene_type:complete
MKIKEASQADVREIYLNMLKREIRNTYTIDDEFKLMNLGLLDKTNEEFVAYRENIALLTDQFKQRIKAHHERNNGN